MIVQIVVITLLIEIVTCIGRFGFKLRSRDVKWPVRIHHGYFGIVLLLIFFFIPSDWLAVVGASLLISDAIHHFVVLPLAVGQTEFP